MFRKMFIVTEYAALSIFNHKTIGNNINALQYTACLVVNIITVDNLLSSLITRWLV